MQLDSNIISIIFYTIKAYYYFILETGPSLFVPPASAPTTETSQEKQESVFTFSDDPAQWVINDYFRDYIAKHGCNQNKNADFKLSRQKYANENQYRSMSASLFQRKMHNNEISNRLWLIYSETGLD